MPGSPGRVLVAHWTSKIGAVDPKYGLALLALFAVLILAWIVVRRGERRRRLNKYRESWEQRGTVLRIVERGGGCVRATRTGREYRKGIRREESSADDNRVAKCSRDW